MEYSINLVLALLFGIFLKIYDDIIDTKLQVNQYYVDLLKYFIITLFSILFYNDAIFSILVFLGSFVSFIMDKYYTCHLDDNQTDLLALNDNIWVYTFILSGVFILYHLVQNFTQLQNMKLGDTKNLTFFLIIFINFIFISLEIYVTPENASDKKLYVRICLLILFIFLFYYMTGYSDSIYEGNYVIVLMYIGWAIASVCFLTLDKLRVFDTLKNTETMISKKD